MNFPPSQRFLHAFILFVLLNLILYLFIFRLESSVVFGKRFYLRAHHFFLDPRVDDIADFNFLRAVGQYDGQWYLKIAKDGYPRNPTNVFVADKQVMDGLAYAFFPLYPAVISFLNIFIRDIELTAFIFANALMALNFASLYFVVGKLYSEKLAQKTVFLLFLFPFAIFFRSYFAEGLGLLLLVWFAYFLVLRRFFWAAVFLGLLNVTRGNVFLLNFVFLFYFLKSYKWQKEFVSLPIIGFLLSFPLVLWIYFVFINTLNPFYFLSVRSAWVEMPFPLFANLMRIVTFPDLHFHDFHSSLVDVLVIVTFFIVIITSRSYLKRELWLVSLCVWLSPLLVTDTMSFSRYQIISFPMFIYLAHVLRGYKYLVVLALFSVGLFVVSLFFVNWYWIG